MMKKIIFLLTFSILIYAKPLTMPYMSLKASGGVIDLMYKDNIIYASTDAGSVDIFDYKNKKLIKQIKTDKIKDFMGDLVNSKVFSVDEMHGSIMILSQSEKGFSRVHIHNENNNKLIIDYKKNLSIIKAKYLDENTILLALLSNELISYDIEKNSYNYRIQVSGGKFSDFNLNKDKTQVAVADESGEVHIINTKTGELLKLLKGQNLDNIFQISYENSIVATAGQDRRVGIYNTKSNSAYNIQSDFLVYSIGLSPSAKITAYSSDENNNVTLFDTNTKSMIGQYGGNEMTISNIIFINEKEFLVSSTNQIINLYSVK